MYKYTILIIIHFYLIYYLYPKHNASQTKYMHRILADGIKKKQTVNNNHMILYIKHNACMEIRMELVKKKAKKQQPHNLIHADEIKKK